ncbi:MULTISPECIES: GNAT family N-acetyltransferase [unclassified Luteococcus]|uniref:GNAT family N-acetyltransferase n=1 Tax=unclassified Luteococcus TaxID=2639923 RepID=UPI00313F20BC
MTRSPEPVIDPTHWEADVVLADGGIAQLRPLTPDDREELIAFYGRVSEQSKYLRFFAAHPQLNEKELHDYTHCDRDRVALMLAVDEQMVAFANYEVLDQLLPARVANVAFLVQDDQQGRGAANILLEHLAEVGRECQVERFTAEMLTQNRKMLQVFTHAGYVVRPEMADGCILVDFPLAATDQSRAVMEQREHKAESNAIRGLLEPRRVAVVGEVMRVKDIAANLVQGGYRGELVVTTGADGSTQAQTRALSQIDGDVDLVVVRAATSELEELIEQASRKHARGILVLASDRSTQLDHDHARQLVSWARTHGLRALGPSALGLVNTDPELQLNASPASPPRQGSVGLFTQSAGVATIVLSRALERGIGLSSFIATGAFADVTGNDVMQYWSDDERTRVCLLSLDSVGNPRKFFRVLRRLALAKHVVVFTPSRALLSAESDVPGLPSAPATALDQVIQNSGAIVCSRRDTMYDVAQILARQPVPPGRRVRVISNSTGLAHQMRQAAVRFGLEPGDPVTIHEHPSTGALEAAAARAVADPEVDAVVVGVVEVVDPVLELVRDGLAELAAGGHETPVVGVFVGFRDPAQTATGPDLPGGLPCFTAYADALRAISLIVDNEERRARQRPHPDDEVYEGREMEVRSLIANILLECPEGRWASDAECSQILAAYGIDLVPWQAVGSAEEAVAAAEGLGWDVVLKATAPSVRGRTDLPTIYFHLTDADAMRRAWEGLGRTASDLGLSDGDPTVLAPVVQVTTQHGTPLALRAIEDEVLGPMLCVGVAGAPADLLDDLAWGVPPLRRTDARTMLDSLRAARLLHGYRGAPPARLDSIEDTLIRLARLKDDQVALAEVELTPVIAGRDRTAIVGARMRIVPLPAERDPLARRAT